MDLFDPFQFGGSATPPPRSQQEQEPSLNEEVSQVIGQLGKFWGGFRKQSQAALETARKDLGQVVTQAQEQLNKLAAPEDTPSTSQATEVEVQDEKHDSSSESVSEERELPSTSSELPSAASPVQALFSRIQSSLPPNISATLQNNIPASLRDASGNLNVDFVQLRSTLTTEFQRVQGVTLAQAEEYVHKSEALLKDAGDFLKDAVKVVPPESMEATDGDVVRDGSDLWMMPFVGTMGLSVNPPVGKGKGKARDDGPSASTSQQRRKAAGTRADTLIQRLKQDPEALKLDPLNDVSAKDMYDAWVKDELEPHGGIDGKLWTEKIQALAQDESDMGALKSTQDVLVPSEMDIQTFWTRYFFRVYEIEKEEEKRRALLAGTAESEDDFSWEDEEEVNATSDVPVSTDFATSAPAPAPHSITEAELASSRKSVETIAPNESARSDTSSRAATPANTSPRESSEDSYDLVSSGNISTAGEEAGSRNKKGGEGEESGDSDWE